MLYERGRECGCGVRLARREMNEKWLRTWLRRSIPSLCKVRVAEAWTEDTKEFLLLLEQVMNQESFQKAFRMGFR